MRLQETMVAWNPYNEYHLSVGVEVGEWPDYKRWSKDWTRTAGACWHNVASYNNLECRVYILNLALTLIVRDHVPAQMVHAQFCLIDEYRQSMPNDMPMPTKKLEKIFRAELQEEEGLG